MLSILLSSGTIVQVTPQVEPIGAVMLVIDGLGSFYVYPERSPVSLDGTPLKGAVLFNMTGGGARVMDVFVPYPETTKSHSVLISGSAGSDPENPGETIFDVLRRKGFISAAILQRGDSMPLLCKMDAVLYLGDNSIHGAEPTPGFRNSAPDSLRALFQQWRDVFGRYTAAPGPEGYKGYDAWALDAARDAVMNLGDRHFILLVNAGAVDSAGQNLGIEGYTDVAAALDAPLGRLIEACRANNVLLIVTSDHGMVFPGAKGKGGHSAAKYAGRPEALGVPLIFIGPGVESLNLGGRWSQVDIAPTLLSILNKSAALSYEGRVMPVKEKYSLEIVGDAGRVELWQGEMMLGKASGDDVEFRGLVRGLYTIKARGNSEEVLVNGDKVLAIEEKKQENGLKKEIIGIILILAINITGILIIARIWRKK